MKISIILPVYNASNYLENNIKSLVSQTYKNTEIIYVDDGSTDDSAKLIKKYQEKYSQIKLYQKKNGGVSSARNFGLTKATGDYILFIDSDDTIDKRLCQKAADILKKNASLDIIVFNYNIAYPDYTKPYKIISGESREITEKEYLLMTPSIWNKVIRKDLLTNNKWHMPEGIIYEDLAAVPIIAKYNPKVYYLDEMLYNYIQSEGSLMRSNEYKKKYEDIFPASEVLYNELKNTPYEEEMEYIITNHLLYLASLNFYQYHKYDKLRKIADDMHKYCPRWKNNRIVKEKFTKKQIVYMNLFYHKLYFLIELYQHINKKGK